MATVDAAQAEPLDLVGLSGLMEITGGSADVVVGIVDGPVALDHPGLAPGRIRALGELREAACRDQESMSCRHGTLVAGVLAGRRGAGAPAIAPDCSYLVRPVFAERSPAADPLRATPGELAAAIVDCVESGAWVINASVALVGDTLGAVPELAEALWYASRHEVLVVAAVGNQAVVAGSALTRHPWVVPVVGYSRAGRPLAGSNLGRSIGRRGLGGPGEGVVSLVPTGRPAEAAGSSVAAAFVTGAAALLWSLSPTASAAEVKSALAAGTASRRRTVTPPLLDAWGAYEVLSDGRARRVVG